MKSAEPPIGFRAHIEFVPYVDDALPAKIPPERALAAAKHLAALGIKMVGSVTSFNPNLTVGQLRRDYQGMSNTTYRNIVAGYFAGPIVDANGELVEESVGRPHVGFYEFNLDAHLLSSNGIDTDPEGS
jgi:hypothetical protein